MGPQRFRILKFEILEDGSNSARLRRAGRSFRLTGPNVGSILRDLVATVGKSSITRDEILRHFEAEQSEIVDQIVEWLCEVGLVDDSENVLFAEDSPLDLFLWSAGLDWRTAKTKINSTDVLILGLNPLSAAIASVLKDCGVGRVRVSDYDEPLFHSDTPSLKGGEKRSDNEPGHPALENARPGYVIVTALHSRSRKQLEWNDRCVLERTPFLPVLLAGTMGTVGPLVIPGKSACLRCADGLNSMFSFEGDTLVPAEEGKADDAYHPGALSVVAGVVATEFCRAASGVMICRTNSVVELNINLGYATPHRILKNPRCDVCSRLLRFPGTEIGKPADFRGGDPQQLFR